MLHSDVAGFGAFKCGLGSYSLLCYRLYLCDVHRQRIMSLLALYFFKHQGILFYYLPECCNLSGDIQQSCWQSILMACRKYIQWYISYLSAVINDWVWWAIHRNRNLGEFIKQANSKYTKFLEMSTIGRLFHTIYDIILHISASLLKYPFISTKFWIPLIIDVHKILNACDN